MGGISRIIRRIRNSILLKILIKKAGGNPERTYRRNHRISDIRSTKISIKRDLMNSWRLKEIRDPDPEDREIMKEESSKIPISRLNSIKKKYWGGNIYNEF